MMARRPDPVPLEPCAGYYTYCSTKGAPIQPVRIVEQDGQWHVIVSGIIEPGSGAADPFGIAFLLWHWPLHRATEAEYTALRIAQEDARPDHPIREPDTRVDLKQTPSLW